MLFIHFALWEFRYSTTRTTEYIDRLQVQLAVSHSYDKKSGGTIGILLWMLLSGGRNARLESQERTMLVLRMMQVTRKLGMESRHVIQDIVLKGLFEDCPMDSDDSIFDADYIRQEVLASRYSNLDENATNGPEISPLPESIELGEHRNNETVGIAV